MLFLQAQVLFPALFLKQLTRLGAGGCPRLTHAPTRARRDGQCLRPRPTLAAQVHQPLKNLRIRMKSSTLQERRKADRGLQAARSGVTSAPSRIASQAPCRWPRANPLKPSEGSAPDVGAENRLGVVEATPGRA